MAMALSIVLAVFFATFAWFTMNREVSSSGMSVKSQSALFELYSETNQAIAVDREILQDFGYTEGVISGSGRMTGGGTSDIQWLLTDDSHLNNRQEREGVNELSEPVTIPQDTGIGPGSHGSLTFYIVPVVDLVDPIFTVDFSLDGLVEEYVQAVDGEGNPRVDGNGKPIYVQKLDENDEPSVDELGNPVYETEYKKLTDSRYTTSYPKYATANNLLRGHIIFYETYDSGTHKYNNRIQNMTITKNYTGQTLTAGQKYPVTIHWIWPNTFGQMILEDKDVDRLLGEAMFANESMFSEETSPRVELATYANSNRDMFFYNISGIESIPVQSLINNEDRLRRYFTDFSNGYNKADQLIGSSADYVLLEAKVNLKTDD